MSERTVPRVECALCGEPFDPTDAGGWCTNDDCGEWQYETYADYDATTASGGGSPPDDGSTPPETADSSAMGDGADDAGEGPADDATEDSAETSGDSQSETSDESQSETPDETPIEKNADGLDVDLDTCPECGASADPSHRFCTGCGTDLDEIRASIAEVTTCPECDADVAEADRYCTSCGADLRATVIAGTSSAGPLEELSLEAYGRSIVVEPDQTVGREVRSLLSDAGRPDDEAVRIHREHVRFVREDGTFFVVDLGENPTAVNDESLEKGDRVAIEPGDELTLSEVVTLTIGAKHA